MKKSKYYIELVDDTADLDPPYIAQSQLFNSAVLACIFSRQIQFLNAGYKINLMRVDYSQHSKDEYEITFVQQLRPKCDA